MTEINRESAEAEFEAWARAMRVDLEIEGLDDNERQDNGKNRYLMVSAIMGGWGHLSDAQEFVVTPRSDAHQGGEIVFRKPKGSAFMAMDKKKKTADFAKLFASMADITSVPPVTFSKLDADDVQLCIAVWSFLLGQ